MSTESVIHRRRRDHASRYVLLSALLHLALFGVLLMFPPVRKAVFGEAPEPPKPELRVEGERLAEIVEQVRDINEEELRADVLELEQIHRQMEQIHQAKMEEFEPFAQKQAAEAPRKAADEIDVAIQAQEDALDALRHAAADPQVAAEALNHAQLRQADAAAAQAEARSRMELMPLPRTQQLHEQAMALHRSAIEAAKVAAEAQAQVQAAQQDARKRADELGKARAELKTWTDRAEKAAELARGRAHAVEQAQVKVQVQAERVAAAEQAAQDAAQAAQAQPGKDSRQAAESAKRKVAEESRELQKAREAEARARAEAQKADAAAQQVQAEQAKRAEAVAAREQSVEAAGMAVAAATETVRSHAQAAAEAQRQALDAQRQVKAQMIQETATAPPVALPRQARALPTESQANLHAMNLAELYERARELESRIADDLHDVRAAELAMLTDVTLAQAKATTDVPRTRRPDIDAQLVTRKITTGDAYKKQAEQIELVRREAESMVNAAANMLSSAAALVRKGEEGSTVALEQIEADAALAAKIAQAAHELGGGAAADLTALMKGLTQKGGEAASAPASPPSSGDAGSGTATDDPANLAAAAGLSVVRGLQPPDLRDIDKGAPARKFIRPVSNTRGVTGGWVFVDSWYTIGPFDNPGRVNIHRQFPPQTVIDLDAVYEGKRGQPIRWRHTQTTDALVIPDNAEPYGIWYAYTELHFEQAADLWIAVGSDDRSDLWINDVKVWSSSDTLKPWRIAEGLRRVHFQQGRNRLLCRIENGHGGMGFSVCILTAEP